MDDDLCNETGVNFLYETKDHLTETPYILYICTLTLSYHRGAISGTASRGAVGTRITVRDVARVLGLGRSTTLGLAATELWTWYKQ